MSEADADGADGRARRSGLSAAAPAPDPASERLGMGLERALGTPFTRGNRVEALRNGVEIFPAMLEAIQGARSRIEFLTFIYWTGEIADRVAEALAAKAREGVEVLVVLDGVGARPMKRAHLERMEAAGVRLRWFRPLPRLKIWQFDNRTHRKALIVDGRLGFTGGVGISAEWEGDARNPQEWRDTHYRIRGPAVTGLRAAFYEDWLEAGGDLTPLFSDAAEAGDEPGPDGAAVAQVIPIGAAVGWNAVARLHSAVIRLAETRLRICTPYFAPDALMTSALAEAAERGVTVEVILPGPHVDKRLSELAGAHNWAPLLEAGVRLLRYQPTMMHAKLITVDGRLSVVGSANFNQRSRLKDHEVVVSLLDRELTRALDGHFDADLDRCKAVALEGWRRRSLPRRALEAGARLLKGEA
ncbi:MAG: phospholipase D-like domain-containing protein [Pseudomonadota bacterium]